MLKLLRKKAPPEPGLPRVCPGCGCLLSDPLWRSCPRCRRELEPCGGCSGCGGCGKK